MNIKVSPKWLGLIDKFIKRVQGFIEIPVQWTFSFNTKRLGVHIINVKVGRF